MGTGVELAAKRYGADPRYQARALPRSLPSSRRLFRSPESSRLLVVLRELPLLLDISPMLRLNERIDMPATVERRLSVREERPTEVRSSETRPSFVSAAMEDAQPMRSEQERKSVAVRASARANAPPAML